MVVVLTCLRSMGLTIVRAAGQRQGRFANASTVNTLQGQTNAHYQ